MIYNQAQAIFLLDLCEQAYGLANTGHCTLMDGFSPPIPIRLNGSRPILLRGDNLDIVGFTASKDGVTYIIWRGTQILEGIHFAAEWVLDGFCFPMINWPGRGKVHRGFDDLYACANASLVDCLSAYPNTNAKLVTGHSLGAAAATLCHADIGGDLLTFACPRVGDHYFARGLWDGPTIRVVNDPDVVPDVPLDQPPIWNFRHGGTELRVYGPGKGNPKLAHAMESYRAGMVGSTSPTRGFISSEEDKP